MAPTESENPMFTDLVRVVPGFNGWTWICEELHPSGTFYVSRGSFYTRELAEQEANRALASRPTLWASADEQRDSWLADVVGARCPECGSRPGACYSICPRSPDYYSPERELADALWNESLSDGEYMSLAVAEYERAHGPGSYCS